MRHAAEVDQRMTALQSDVTEAEAKLKRLYRMVEDGLTERDDLLRERIADLKLARDKAKAALDRITQSRIGPRSLDPALIDAFNRVMRDNITTGEIPLPEGLYPLAGRSHRSGRSRRPHHRRQGHPRTGGGAWRCDRKCGSQF